MNKSTSSTIGFVLAIVLLTGLIVYFSKPKLQYSQDSLDKFAMCLADKKLTMYGADWCPHCKAEKALFGSSFKYVPYVECPENQKLCMDKGINGYPTWIVEGGNASNTATTSAKYEGQQGLERLSQISGCVLE